MPSRPPGPTAFPSSWARRCAVLVLVLLVPLTATACRSASDPTASPERLTRNDAQVSLASHPVPTTTKIHRVHGRLPDARRKAVRRQVVHHLECEADGLGIFVQLLHLRLGDFPA